VTSPADDAIAPGPEENDEAPGESEDLRTARLELKLCKALAALNPPHEVATLLHGRIVEQLGKLRRLRAIDEDVRQVFDLTDEELREAAGIVRAVRGLPSWMDRGLQGGVSFRAALGGYALDLVDEIDKRGRGKP
jgi:hypothetical protein